MQHNSVSKYDGLLLDLEAVRARAEKAEAERDRLRKALQQIECVLVGNLIAELRHPQSDPLWEIAGIVKAALAAGTGTKPEPSNASRDPGGKSR
jgi:hypothetical protein